MKAKTRPYSERYFARLGQQQEREDWTGNSRRDFHPNVSVFTRSAAKSIARPHLATFLRMVFRGSIENAELQGGLERDCVDAMVDAYLTARRMRPEQEVVL